MANRMSRYVGWAMLPFVAAACNGRGPTTPTGDPGQSVSTSPAPPAPPPLAPQQPVAFEFTGVVSADDGTPVSGAKITVNFLTSAAPGTFYSQTSSMTNGLGVYTIAFTAVPGAMKGPVGTDDAVAFAFVVPPGCPACAYEDDSRYIVSTTQRAIQNFQLYRIIRITAGESTVLTIAPDDTICFNNVQDFHPSPEEFVCRTVRIVAPSDGIMNVEAIPVQAGAALPMLVVQTVGGPGPCCSERIANPTSLSVAAGTEVMAFVELPWGSTASQSFIVKTSMAAK